MSDSPPPLRLMVASTVYQFKTELEQMCGMLKSYGYEVLNSHIGTIRPHPGKSNLENSLVAVDECDAFLGIILPFYGTGVIGARSITHEEIRHAIAMNKPRWFLAHRDVTFARQLLRPLMYKQTKDEKGETIRKRTDFTLTKTAVMDDVRVIDMYNDAVRDDVKPVADRTGNWVQEFYRATEANDYIQRIFANVERVRQECAEMRSKP